MGKKKKKKYGRFFYKPKTFRLAKNFSVAKQRPENMSLNTIEIIANLKLYISVTQNFILII